MEKNMPVAFRTGNRVFIGPTMKEDVPLITKFINDQEVHQYLTIDRPQTIEDEEKWHSGLSDRKSDIIFATRLTGTKELIGIQGLHHVNLRDGTATMGYFIGRKDLWSKGYGTEAQMLLLEYAFNTLNLHRVSAEVYDFNPRSKRCLEKCGYVIEGVQKEYRYRNGRRADCIMLAVFKRDFLPIFEKYRKEHFEEKVKQSKKPRAKRS